MYAKSSRTKRDHVLQTGLRFSNPQARGNYVQESIRGMSDVTRQQPLQGCIGYMSRMAKVASMCFVRKENHLIVVTRTRKVTLETGLQDSYGCPCLRGISRLCSVSQQSALDSHRVSRSDMPAHDMISDLLQGNESTVIVLPEGYKGMSPLTWACHKDGFTVGILALGDAHLVASWPIAGAYSPLLLGYCKNPRAACVVGLTLIFNYFSITVDPQELSDMAWMFCYNSDASSSPITTSAGMQARKLGWVDTLMMHSYGTLRLLGEEDMEHETPCTGTSAMLCGNYLSLQ